MDDSRPGTDPMDLHVKELIDAGGDVSVLANEIQRLATVIDSLHQRLAALEKITGPNITALG
jgi:hypothetical protein